MTRGLGLDRVSIRLPDSWSRPAQADTPSEAGPSRPAPEAGPLSGLQPRRRGLQLPTGLNIQINVPKLPTKAETAQKLAAGPVTKAQLHAIAQDFTLHAGMPVAITGSFALEIHAGKPLHRPINDIDFVVADLPQLKFSLRDSEIFDASNVSEGEDNGWIIHRPTGHIFDVLQAGPRFGTLDTLQHSAGLPVMSLDSLVASMKKRTDKRDDLEFANSLR